MKAYRVADYPQVESNVDLLNSVTSGFIKAAMLDFYERHKHVNAHLKVCKKPEQQLIALKAFPKGKLVIAPLSRNVAFHDPSHTLTPVQFLVPHDDGNHMVRKDFSWPDNTPVKTGCYSKAASAHIVPFWIVRQSKGSEEVNMEKLTTTVPIKVGKQVLNCVLPYYTNVVDIEEGTEVVLGKDDDEVEDEAPPPPRKVPRTARPAAVAKAGAVKSGKGATGKGAKGAKGKSKKGGRVPTPKAK